MVMVTVTFLWRKFTKSKKAKSWRKGPTRRAARPRKGLSAAFSIKGFHMSYAPRATSTSTSFDLASVQNGRLIAQNAFCLVLPWCPVDGRPTV